MPKYGITSILTIKIAVEASRARKTVLFSCGTSVRGVGSDRTLLRITRSWVGVTVRYKV